MEAPPHGEQSPSVYQHCTLSPLLVVGRNVECQEFDSDSMERLIRPVARQLLRPRPRYPFAVPPPVYAKRLYTMGHTVPPVGD